MPYIMFKFQSGDVVYVPRAFSSIRHPVFVSLTVRRFYRINNTNYYRLSDGRVLKEKDILSLVEYTQRQIEEKEKEKAYILRQLGRI